MQAWRYEPNVIDDVAQRRALHAKLSPGHWLRIDRYLDRYGRHDTFLKGWLSGHEQDGDIDAQTQK